MKKLVRGAALLAGLAILVVSATALAAPASANGLSSTISDPAGDTLKISPGNAPTPAYLDIIGVAVTRHGTSFEFSVDLAAPSAEPARVGQRSESVRVVLVP